MRSGSAGCGMPIGVDEYEFKDPLKGRALSLRVIPVDRLETIAHQRKPRPSHIEHLTSSMERVGFIVPVVAIERQEDGTTSYIVIDGQHRLEAVKSLDVSEVPVIVVPEDLSPRMMNLNVEKDLNIREKAFVSLGIYRSIPSSTPENDPEVVDSIERAYYVTLGIAYERASRLAGSSFEPLLKKCDFFLEENLEECHAIRGGRADALLEANKLVKAVTDHAKELGIWHQYFQAQLLSYVDPYKRKRGPLDFDDVFGKVIAKLTDLSDEPDRIGKVIG
jgi:ParB family transcriptional regulator, chromosome partitioning protein